ncbi:hypothetical protein [Fischerella thermalis]|jgi:hypothetical protein|uniref:hypothetical protein n=1 Tax=Fischerella thermalis TaxID=372787 RepID=UPI002155094E|nr:hypothetical protein [Fischerella thermalis]
MFYWWRRTWREKITINSIDFKAFWDSARKKRNYFSHRLGGLAEKEVFRAWGEDVTNSEQWQKRILNCLNLVTGKSFRNLAQASVFATIHDQVLQAITKHEI